MAILSRIDLVAASKALMGLIGFDCGPCRLPLVTFTDRQAAALREELNKIDFFSWPQTWERPHS